MVYEPPQGRELVVTKKMEEIVRRLDEGIPGSLREDIPCIVHACISSGHALDGVRVNGCCKLTNILTVYKDMEKFKIDMDGYVKRVSEASEQLDKALLEVEELMGEFTICPLCQGSKGQEIEPKRGFPGEAITRWRDCERCGGKGMLPNTSLKDRRPDSE